MDAGSPFRSERSGDFRQFGHIFVLTPLPVTVKSAAHELRAYILVTVPPSFICFYSLLFPIVPLSPLSQYDYLPCDRLAHTRSFKFLVGA